jgi:hypothetical protein
MKAFQSKGLLNSVPPPAVSAKEQIFSRWWVFPPNRPPYEVSLEDLESGVDQTEANGFNGRPNLTRSISGTVMDLVRGKASSTSAGVKQHLRYFWRFLDAYERDGGPTVDAIQQITDDLGTLFKIFLLQMKIQRPDITLTKVTSILSSTREREGLEPLRWPYIEFPDAPKFHSPVDQKAVLRVAKFAMLRLRSRVPDAGRDSMNAATVFVRDLIVDGKWSSLNLAHSNAIKWQDRLGDPTAAIHALAQDALEATCRHVVVTAETGWLDAAKEIDITQQWYVARNTEGDARHGTVILLSRRPKTGVLVSHLALPTHGGAFGTILGAESRTQFLRQLLDERMAVLEGQMWNPEVRAEIEYARHVKRSPFLALRSQCARKVGAYAVSSYPKLNYYFNTLKESLLATRRASTWSEVEREAIRALRLGDLRDAFGARVYEKSGGNLFALKAGMGHLRVRSTEHYVRQRAQVAERFRRFAMVTGIALDEVMRGYTVDPRILMARAFSGTDRGISEEVRRALSGPRTRLGMGCADPESPPPEIAPGHRRGAICSVQRCVLCKHGFFFKDEPGAMASLAMRHGELLAMADFLPPEEFQGSSFEVELATVEAARDLFYAQNADQFNVESQRIRQEIELSRRPYADPLASSESKV